MVLDAFQQRKAVVLAGLQADCGDKSRKGSVDAPVAALVAAINRHPAVYTTSSCSGRITVFGEPTEATRAAGKKGGEWVYASHDPADPEEVVAAVHRRAGSGAQLVLRFEPFILALEANSAMMGQRVLAAARAAGFRESGLTLGSGGRRVMVGVRCSLRLEVPVADGGSVLVPDTYLRYCVGLANDKFRQNLDRISRFEQELMAALMAEQPPPQPASPGAAAAAAAAGGASKGSLAVLENGAVGNGPHAASAADRAGARRDAAAGERDGAGLAAVPPRRRRGGGGGGGGGFATAAEPLSLDSLVALKSRQARLLGRIQGLELRLAGRMGAKGDVQAAGVVGNTTGAGAPVARGAGARSTEAPLTALARGAPASLSAAAVKTSASVTACGELQWRPVPVALGQGTTDEDVPRWGHASAVAGPRVYLLGGYGGGGAHARRSDVLVYDTTCRTWEALPAPSPAAGSVAPAPRMGHAAAAIGDGYVVLVGGRTSPVDALSDVWILDLRTAVWIQVQPQVDPVTTAGVCCTSVAFPGRYRHTVVAVPPPSSSLPPPPSTEGCGAAAASEDARLRSLDGWRVVVFGGRNAEAVLGDAWVLTRGTDPRVGSNDAVAAAGGGDDCSSLASGWRWQQVSASDGAPSPRKSHAACFMPLAGYASTGGPVPGASAAAVSTAAPTAAAGRMYVHGGTCGYGLHFNDTYYLDLDSYAWHRVVHGEAQDVVTAPSRSDSAGAGLAPTTGGAAAPAPLGGGSGVAGCEAGDVPPACFSHTLSAWGPYLLLVGGYPTDHHRQLCVLDTRTHQWHTLEVDVAAAAAAAPLPRAPSKGSLNHSAGQVGGKSEAAAGAAVAAASPPPPPPHLDFVPIRHCAEVVRGEPHDSLYVFGGGAFCFSFGTVFGGCFELPLHQRGLERLLQLRRQRQQQQQQQQQEHQQQWQQRGAESLDDRNSAVSRGAGDAGVSASASASVGSTVSGQPAASGDGSQGGPGGCDSGFEVVGRAAVQGHGDQPAAGETGEEGWLVCVPASGAKAVKDALKAAGWLDSSRRAGTTSSSGSAAAAAANGCLEAVAGRQPGPQVNVLLPVTEGAARALQPLLAGGGPQRLLPDPSVLTGNGSSSIAEVASLLASAGAQLLTASLPRASKLPLSPAQRLRAAVAELLTSANPGLAAASSGGSIPSAVRNSSGASAGGGGGGGLFAEMLADLPSKWERLGDLALLPAGSMTHPGWVQALGGVAIGEGASGSSSSPSSGGGGGGEGREESGGGGGESGDVLLPLWRTVAAALGVSRLARQAPVANTGTRDSRAVLLLGSDGWVAHREGGVTFRLDVTRCMFSSGNVTERTRLGWGKGGLAEAAAAAAAPAAAVAPATSASAAAPTTLTENVAKSAPAAAAAAKISSKPATSRSKTRAAAGPKSGPAAGASGAAGSGRPGWAAGETVVDLFCGIGYYTVPLLVVGGAAKVYACEWNPHALEALRRNLEQPPLDSPSGPPVASRCEVRAGDCRLTAPADVADRVLLGLLPSSRVGWETAIRALKPATGGWLHLHHNVTDSEEAAWLAAAMEELRRLAAAEGRDWRLELRHVERVKWYAPHIRHIVLDIECRPAGQPPPRLQQRTPSPRSPSETLLPSETPVAVTPVQPQQPEAQPSRPPEEPPRPAVQQATSTSVLGQRWYEQPLELLQPVRRLRGPISREDFERDISPARSPVVLEGLDLGPAPSKWTSDYLATLPSAQSTLVSVHVSRDPSGCLDFAGRKNFAFRTMTLAELVGRMRQQERRRAAAAGAGGEGGATLDAGGDGAAVAARASTCDGEAADREADADWPELVPRGEEFGEGPEVLYLRSIGENPRREPACLSASFPSLAADLVLPPLFPPEALHSSVLRISSPGLVLWTHYDVMDNLLIQVTGTKRVLLWPPSCHDALHVSGSSSPIIHLRQPDLERFPRYAACPAPLLADLRPGDVLFLPSLWFHNVTTTGATSSISVNAFWRHLPQEHYHRKDLYGNRDLVEAEAADKAADEALAQLMALPPHYRDFYGARLLGRLGRDLQLGPL